MTAVEMNERIVVGVPNEGKSFVLNWEKSEAECQIRVLTLRSEHEQKYVGTSNDGMGVYNSVYIEHELQAY